MTTPQLPENPGQSSNKDDLPLGAKNGDEEVISDTPNDDEQPSSYSYQEAVDITPEEQSSRYKEDKLSRYGLLVLLGAVFLAVIPIFRLFLVPAILAATFATLFYPMYRWILVRVKGRRGLSSFLSCFILLIGMLVPTYLLVHLVAKQTIELYGSANTSIREIVRKGDQGFIGDVKKSRPMQLLRIDKINWQELAQEAGIMAGRIGSIVINRTSESVVGLVANLAVMMFTMFYLFMDGEKIVRKFGFLSPLRHGYEQLLLERFTLISRATIKGTLLIGLAQGILGALTLLIGGVQTWLLWGFVMIILSIIPMIGAWLVLIPAGIVQIALGDVFQGIFILVVSTAVISNVDNLLRPRLVGHDAKMHDLLIFFSTLGGIAVFGIMGFIIGPVIVSLFVALLDIYETEFRDQLESLDSK